jgi:nucleotide-binding universal stress UspA family protein
LIAQLLNSPLTLLTVIGDDNQRQLAEASISNAQELLQGQDVSTKLRSGDPLAEILKEAHETDYEIIVVGSHDVLRLLDSLMGTLSDKVADRAHSHVLIVRGERKELNQILIPIGGQKMNPDVVKMGARLAAASDAQVTLLYVKGPVPTMYTGLEGMDETLPELLETDTPVSQHLRWSAEYLSDKGVKAELKLQQGAASDEILREAIIADYDLIVIGARSHDGWLKRLFLVDQVTPHVIERAPCPVLVVH